MRELHTELRIVYSLNIGHIGLDTDIIQTARLGEGDRLIGKRIGAGEVFEVIQAVIGINRQHSCGAEDVNVTRCKVDAMHQLTLILAQRLLIELVRRIKQVPRQEKIHVESVFGIRAVIEPIEDVA